MELKKKSSLTASVATVPPKELSKQMGHSVAAALQGRAPGVEILAKGGRSWGRYQDTCSGSRYIWCY